MARIICLLLFSWLVAGEQNVEEGGKCQRITLPLCQDLGYNYTAMPNLLGHKDQKEAEEAMAVFAPILTSGCSAHARFLVCSAFAPLCSEQVSGVVSACRALCDAVLADWAACGAAATPATPATASTPASPTAPALLLLDCGVFPRRADRRLCMRPPNASELEPEPAPPLALPAPAAPRWPLRDRDLGLGDAGCPPGRVRGPAGECRPACGRDVGFTREDKQRAEAGTAALAWLSLLSTAFALLTFCAEPARYRYPERPVVWTAACHALVALAYVARGWLGARRVTCAGAALAGDGLAAPPCVAFFALTYYFTLAADAWFANACVAWYLTAASEWSTEALERAAAYLHAAAWGWAGAWTAAALALRRVAADELSGTCGVEPLAAAALVGVPRAALLLAAAALAAAACPGIARVRRALDPRGARRVGRLAARAAAAGLLYFSLAALATVASVLEARARLRTTEVSLLAALEGGEAPAGGAWAGGVWAAAASGAGAGAWAWSRKSGAVWRRALCPARARKAPCCSPPLLRADPPYYKRPLHVSRV